MESKSIEIYNMLLSFGMSVRYVGLVYLKLEKQYCTQ